MNFKPTYLAALAASMFAVSMPASAVEWGGYFRSGPGGTKKDVSRACYGLAGEGLKYRLGNECDFYGEFALSETIKKNDVEVKALFMTNYYNGGTDIGHIKDSGFSGVPQMYVEGKGFDIAPNVKFWVGKRFLGRTDVHIVDQRFTELDGVGAGADAIDLGGAKVGLAYFTTDGATANQPGQRFNVDVSDIGVNPGGKLRILTNFVRGNFTGGKSGFGLTVQHNQSMFGGGNTLWLQYAQGSADLKGTFGTLDASSGNKKIRVVDSVNWQSGPFGGQVIGLVQRDTIEATGGSTSKVTSATVGGRVSYALMKHFKMVAEAGYSQKKPDGAATQKLSKFTIAPTLSMGPEFWSRPELRFYVTTAKWNSAANAAAGANGIIGTAAEADKRSGTSYGFQAEIWF
ncbi:carbohydrate porin [Piscinibacter sp. HJYY11]|uniref:maltoporin n=1 Tax=Piscinibacter sp. HJYY11 TaxID=2801333 RepID=UPI00191F7219|nr:carbohydrate porin [Piscinibacter sp. HJYY11]MBL0729630.1 carbohydrate porin [Piscinibacter sp. HJYY11]